MYKSYPPYLTDQKPSDHYAHSSAPTPRAGFALIIAISLMSFIMVLLLALSSVSISQQKESALATDQAKARQNALYGHKLALGQLQKHAGPDQSVTGTAGLLDPDESTVEVETTSTPDYDGVNHPYWTGVWQSDYGGELPWGSGFEAHPVAGADSSNPKGKAAWLVPQNLGEAPGDGLDPTSAAFPVADGAYDYVWLGNSPENPRTDDFPDMVATPDGPRRIIGERRAMSTTDNEGHFSYSASKELLLYINHAVRGHFIREA